MGTRLPERYLVERGNRQRYLARLEMIRSADAVLAISEATGRDAVRLLGIPPARVHAVMAGCSDDFRPAQIPCEEIVRSLRAQVPELKPNYFLSTNGIDYRKNIRGLIAGYARLPDDIRAQRQLIITGQITSAQRSWLTDRAREHGMQGRVVLPGYVPDHTLKALYQVCGAFVFPSLYEGFGLPVVEALRCGAVVVVSENSSLPEIVPDPDARFDPTSPENMSRVMERAVQDRAFRRRLQQSGPSWAARFTWERVAEATEEVYQRVLEQRSETAVPSVPGAAGV